MRYNISNQIVGRLNFMQTISFRLDEHKKTRLDTLAAVQDRDRSYVINAAIDSYLALMDWQLDHIRKGIEQADHGDFATDEEFEATLARWKQ
jgi:predicted transcriptional regulator